MLRHQDKFEYNQDNSLYCSRLNFDYLNLTPFDIGDNLISDSENITQKWLNNDYYVLTLGFNTGTDRKILYTYQPPSSSCTDDTKNKNSIEAGSNPDLDQNPDFNQRNDQDQAGQQKRHRRSSLGL